MKMCEYHMLLRLSLSVLKVQLSLIKMARGFIIISCFIPVIDISVLAPITFLAASFIICQVKCTVTHNHIRQCLPVNTFKFSCILFYLLKHYLIPITLCQTQEKKVNGHFSAFTTRSQRERGKKKKSKLNAVWIRGARGEVFSRRAAPVASSSDRYANTLFSLHFIPFISHN